MPSKDNTEDAAATPEAASTVVAQGSYQAAEFGLLWLSWSDRGLVELTLPGGNRPSVPDDAARDAAIPERWRAILDDYFSGVAVDFREIPVDPEGTKFQHQVWEALRDVPHGKVRSYAGIASDIGNPRAMRAVGAANAKNPIPIVIPCHRVVEQGNHLGGYSGGLDKKRFLLQLEGAELDGDEVLPGQLSLI